MSDSGLYELAEEARKLREALAPMNHGNVTQMMMPPPTDGERAVHQVKNVAFFFAGLLLGVFVIVLQQGNRINAMNASLDSERIERKMFELWAYDEAKTMRTFVKTGVLAPMKPMQEERKK